MMNHSSLVWINDVNKHRINQPTNTNRIYFSSLFQADSCNAFRNISIKYVLEGCEYYRIDKTEYEINAGKFLLANQQPNGQVYFQSKQLVKGICIDINSRLLGGNSTEKRR